MSRPLQTAGLEEAGRGAPSARKEPKNPYPESICTARTVTVLVTESISILTLSVCVNVYVYVDVYVYVYV